MTAPVIRQFVGSIPDKGQAQTTFDTNVDAFLDWQALQFAPDLVAFGTWASSIKETIGFTRLSNAASVFANSTLAYSTAPGKIAVAAGSYVLTDAEGFSYQVAASAATDQHVTTLGGVKLYVQAGASGANVLAFGAIGDGTTLNDTAFTTAASTSDMIVVPQGTYRVSTPMTLGFSTKYAGPGVLKFDKAEWWGEGGSAGPTATYERYTLFYEYSLSGDVYLEYDDVPQSFTFVNDNTIQAVKPASGVEVKYGINNGFLKLSTEFELVRSYNMLANGGANIAPSLADPLTSPTGFQNASFGSRSLKEITTGTNNTAIGSRSLVSLKTGDNNVGVGFQTLYRATGSRNTAMGSIAGEWLTTGVDNTALGYAAGAKMVTAGLNTAIGSEAMGENQDGGHNVCVGHRALGNSGDSQPDENVAVGNFAGDFVEGNKNTLIGYGAGRGASGLNTANENVFGGFFAGRDIRSGSLNVGIGVYAGLLLTTATQCVAIGHGALSGNLTAAQNTAVGFEALKGATAAEGTAVGYQALTTLTTGIRNTAIGSRAARLLTTGNSNTAVGRDALINAATGDGNTALGLDALKLKIDATPFDALSNCTGVGQQTYVSGSNQVQIGNSETTAYVYGTVQNRSDLRDKADVRDTTLGLDFINALRPVDYRWDMREDYIAFNEETGEASISKRDGSKKRDRYHHGIIAQDLQELLGKTSVDFGGYQDHGINGGADVMSVGYDEFIAPLIKAIQELTHRIKTLEDADGDN